MSVHAGFAGIDLDSLRRAGRMVVSIEGMWCASCALAVERVMLRTPGVTSASTSFSGGSALIRWDSDAFDPHELLRRVERLGYRAVPLIEADVMEQRIDEQARAVWLRLAVACFFGMWSMLGSLVLYLHPALAGAPEGWWIALGACVAALPAVTYSAMAFYRAGWRTLVAGVPGMDALISLGVLAACALSLWRLLEGSAEVYVDTATMLVAFLLCGRLIELHARRRNSAAVNALKQAVPEVARRVAPDGSSDEVAAATLQVGERVLVYAGERICVDGIVIEGDSDVDRAVVTGESAPVPVGPGASVEAGSVNLSCQILVRVGQPYGERFIDRIGVRMLELFGAKSAVALQAERFARLLIPFALATAALAFIYAFASSGDLAHAALRSLSVLVAACPCAVGLALPLAYTASAATAARHGILFRDPASMEALAGARDILFDKTGTLTTGRLEVVDVLTCDTSRSAVLHWAAVAEAGIAHPVAEAVRRAAMREDPEAGPDLQGSGAGTSRRYGQGVAWKSVQGRRIVLVGSAAWLTGHAVKVPEPTEAPKHGGSEVHVALDGEWIGALMLRDTLREDAREAVRALQAQGVRAALVTGDAHGPALAVAIAAGLQPDHVHAGCQPETKVDIVEAAQGPVVFVGDGVNDSLALAAADCGIAVHGATAAAVATAGVVISRGGIGKVVVARRHARRTFAIVRQNLVFSMIYNVGILGLAASGTVPPVAAAGAMLASSLSVVANAARLSRISTGRAAFSAA